MECLENHVTVGLGRYTLQSHSCLSCTIHQWYFGIIVNIDFPTTQQCLNVTLIMTLLITHTGYQRYFK